MADAFDLAWDSAPSTNILSGSSADNPTVINLADNQPDAFDLAWDSSQELGIGSALLKGAREAPRATYEAVKAIPSGLSNLLTAVVSPKQSLESGNTETVARGLGALGAGAAGAGVGASTGASIGLLGGPLAPITVPAGGIIGGALGGAAGLLGFDYLNQATGADKATTGQQDVQKLAEMTGGGVAMGAIGGAVKGGANMLASSPKLAEVLNRKSIGARQGDFAKSLKAKGFQETVEGDTTLNLAKSIEQVRKEGGFSGTRDPVALLDKNTSVLNSIEDNLSGVLKEADSVNTQSPVIPKYKISEDWIKTQPAAERGALTEALDEIKAAQNNILDGSLEALQAEKRALYGKTYGESGAAKEALAKYVASDLRAAIETGVDDLVKQGALPEKYSGVVKSLNERSGTYQEVRPILSRKVVQSMTDDPIAKLANIGFTTGGIGGTTGIGGWLGGPVGAAIGAGVGLTGKALTTPTGQALTAAGLRGVGKVANPISNLLNSVLTSKTIGAAQAAGEITEKESDALKLARKVLNKPDLSLTQEDDMKVNPIVSQFEGGQRLKAYEPPAKGSGVTVATGIDLGQRSAKELEDLGLSEALINKVRPYLGVKDAEAKGLLKSKPLSLTQDEADELDSAIGQKISSEVSSKYLKATGQDLSELPEEARTVIESLAYNFGPNLDSKLPTLWKHVTNNNWDKVQDFLVNTKWKQPELTKRRKREAALLNPLINQAKV